MSTVKRIFELQQIEAAIVSAHKQLEEINSHIAHNDVVDQAKGELDAAKESLDGMERQYRDLDAEAEDLRQHIRRLEDKLYGGKIKNPKELMGYEQESDILKGKLVKMDDSLLEMMEKIESGKLNLDRLKKAFDEAEENWHSEIVPLKQQAGQLTSELAELEARRKDHLQEIDKGTLSLYERIKGRKAHAVVRVEQGRCTGCKVSLSVSELQRVRGTSVVQCSNCGRILYLS